MVAVLDRRVRRRDHAHNLMSALITLEAFGPDKVEGRRGLAEAMAVSPNTASSYADLLVEAGVFTIEMAGWSGLRGNCMPTVWSWDDTKTRATWINLRERFGDEERSCPLTLKPPMDVQKSSEGLMDPSPQQEATTHASGQLRRGRPLRKQLELGEAIDHINTQTDRDRRRHLDEDNYSLYRKERKLNFSPDHPDRHADGRARFPTLRMVPLSVEEWLVIKDGDMQTDNPAGVALEDCPTASKDTGTARSRPQPPQGDLPEQSCTREEESAAKRLAERIRRGIPSAALLPDHAVDADHVSDRDERPITTPPQTTEVASAVREDAPPLPQTVREINERREREESRVAAAASALARASRPAATGPEPLSDIDNPQQSVSMAGRHRDSLSDPLPGSFAERLKSAVE